MAITRVLWCIVWNWDHSVFTLSDTLLVSQVLLHSEATRLMLFANLLFISFLLSISPRPLNGSPPNFPRRRHMNWHRKCGVKLLKYLGGQVGEQICPHYIKYSGQKREFFKKETLSDSGRINSIREGESRTKIGQAMPEKRWRVCTHSRTCVRC